MHGESEWIEFQATPDRHGRIILPKHLRKMFGEVELTIQVRPYDPDEK